MTKSHEEVNDFSFLDPTIEPLENWVLQERFSQFNKFTPNVLSMAIQRKLIMFNNN